MAALSILTVLLPGIAEDFLQEDESAESSLSDNLTNEQRLIYKNEQRLIYKLPFFMWESDWSALSSQEQQRFNESSDTYTQIQTEYWQQVKLCHDRYREEYYRGYWFWCLPKTLSRWARGLGFKPADFNALQDPLERRRWLATELLRTSYYDEIARLKSGDDNKHELVRRLEEFQKMLRKKGLKSNYTTRQDIIAAYSLAYHTRRFDQAKTSPLAEMHRLVTPRENVFENQPMWHWQKPQDSKLSNIYDISDGLTLMACGFILFICIFIKNKATIALELEIAEIVITFLLFFSGISGLLVGFSFLLSFYAALLIATLVSIGIGLFKSKQNQAYTRLYKSVSSHESQDLEDIRIPPSKALTSSLFFLVKAKAMLFHKMHLLVLDDRADFNVKQAHDAYQDHLRNKFLEVAAKPRLRRWHDNLMSIRKMVSEARKVAIRGR